jgi:hypothetical protein
MSSPKPSSFDVSSNAMQLSIIHEASSSKFTLKFPAELIIERNGLRRLLKVLVPKVNESAKIFGNVCDAVLSYRDEDGDLITVRTDSDLKEAVRLASLRQLSINISFDESLQQSLNANDASAGPIAVSWSDSSSDVQIECESSPPPAVPDIPPAVVEQPINLNAASTAPTAVSSPQIVPSVVSIQSSVDDSQRIFRIEQAVQQCVASHLPSTRFLTRYSQATATNLGGSRGYKPRARPRPYSAESKQQGLCCCHRRGSQL